jgi:hypothetical protein
MGKRLCGSGGPGDAESLGMAISAILLISATIIGMIGDYVGWW